MANRVYHYLSNSLLNNGFQWHDGLPNPFDEDAILQIVWCLSCRGFHIINNRDMYESIDKNSPTFRLWKYCLPNLVNWFTQVIQIDNQGQRSPRIDINTVREKKLIMMSISIQDKAIFDVYIQKELSVDEILDKLELMMFADLLGK